MSSFHELLQCFRVQANNFLEFFPFSEIPVFETAILAYKPKVRTSEMPPVQVLIYNIKAIIVQDFKPLPRLAQLLYVSGLLRG